MLFQSKEENFRGMLMMRILKATALILFVVAVVFADGCAQKATTSGNENASPSNEIVSPSNEIVSPSNEIVTPPNVTTKLVRL
jgi:hypothetical protein